MRTRTFPLALLLAASPLAWAQAPVDLEALSRQVSYEHPEIPAAALRRAFAFLKDHYVQNTRYIGIVNFDQPSNQRRLSVIRLSDGRVEKFLVAHGEGSGERYATEFSDEHRSHQSALGIYLTDDEYEGKHGRSLKLRGMEGSNNESESRAIVIHGAGYVSDETIREQGMIGRSWGCPAVDYDDRDHIIDELHGGAILLLYHS